MIQQGHAARDAGGREGMTKVYRPTAVIGVSRLAHFFASSRGGGLHVRLRGQSGRRTVLRRESPNDPKQTCPSLQCGDAAIATNDYSAMVWRGTAS